MRIALAAFVLLAVAWFTVLRPKSDSSTEAPIPAQTTTAQPAAGGASAKTAPGVSGLAGAVAKANGAVATSTTAANATQSAAAKASDEAVPAATGAATTKATGAATPTAAAGAASPAAATKAAEVKKAAADKAAAAAKKAALADADPSTRLFPFLDKGKVVVLLFYGKGADDRAARKAVRRIATTDKNVISAYAPITDVGKYEAITTDVPVMSAPTVLVIGKDHKAITLNGFIDAATIAQTVGDIRRALATAAKAPAKASTATPATAAAASASPSSAVPATATATG
jgi:hypothetical protein